MKNTTLTPKEISHLWYKSLKIIIQAAKWRVLLLVFSTFVAAITPSASLWISRIILNQVQIRTVSVERLIYLCLLYIAVEVLILINSKVHGYVNFKTERRVTLYLNNLILKKTNELELSDFENAVTYNMIKRAKDTGISQLFPFFHIFITMGQAIITISTNILIIYHIQMNWIFIIITGLIIVKTFVLIRMGQKRYGVIRARSTEERQKWYYQFLLSNDIAFKEIKLFKLSDYFMAKYNYLYNKAFKQDDKLLIESSFKEAFFSFLDILVMGYAFVYTMISAFLGNIYIGDASTFMRGAGTIKNSISNLCNQLVNISNTAYYINDIFEFLNIKTYNEGATGKSSIDKINSIEFVNVSFKYDNSDEYIIRNFNHKFCKGESYAVLGKNGRGKSTILKLISGLYRDYEGTILINSIDLKDIDIDNYQKLISALFQDFVKYELSLRENIALSNLENLNKDEKIKKLLSDMNITDKRFYQLDRQLGSWFKDGSQVSGGEWQKVALCRTFFQDYAELIILDEPNAALDSQSSENLFKFIDQNKSDKICIFIAHRIAEFIDYADKIIFLDEDNVYVGTHEELYNYIESYQLLFKGGMKNYAYR